MNKLITSSLCFVLMVFLNIAPATPRECECPRPSYLDDRSGAEELIQSFFNAINSHQYSRAWSYFTHSSAEAYGEFIKDYSKYESIEVLTGKIEDDFGAGQYYNIVPFVARTISSTGVEVYTGCVTTLLSSPSAQEVPFTPRHIHKLNIKRSSRPFVVESAPDSCTR